MADDNTDILARTIYGEARGEGDVGMGAVACVALNRAAIARAYVRTHQKPHPLFGDGTAASACKMPWQFSCWNAADLNSQIINDVDDSDPVFAGALHIAADALNGLINDETKNATHYYDRRIATPPSWAEGKSPCAVIGHHIFFNNIT